MLHLAERRARYWGIASWVLLAAWVCCAALVMNRVRGGFVTNYGADLTQPAWLYIVVRELPRPGANSVLHRIIGSRPETAALVIFVAGTLTEVSQLYWPAGLFSGRFDPYDLVAFASGISACYIVDKYLIAYPGNDTSASISGPPN
jgi:hypothetical protein